MFNLKYQDVKSKVLFPVRVYDICHTISWKKNHRSDCLSHNENQPQLLIYNLIHISSMMRNEITRSLEQVVVLQKNQMCRFYIQSPIEMNSTGVAEILNGSHVCCALGSVSI